SLGPSMNPSVSQMNIFNLPFQCIGRLQRGHPTLTIGLAQSSSKPEDMLGKPPLLDYSCPIDLLVLPRVASKLCNLSKAAGCATFLAHMVGVSATSSASNVSPLSAGFSQ